MKRIYLQDMTDLGYCVKGIRFWFRDRNLNFDEFLRRGIKFEVLEKYRDCGMCDNVLKRVESNGK